jgi:predicted 2-oxoglutarate/Fe(II)-dependent dioxygenase YbiX
VDENLLKKSNSPLANSLKKAQDLLLEASLDYASHFNLLNISHSSINLSKYLEGKAMGAHVDADLEKEDQAAITAILYLNDNYEGGELFFREQQITLKPKAGTIVVFPSHTPFFHESFLIKKGSKYIMALF